MVYANALSLGETAAKKGTLSLSTAYIKPKSSAPFIVVG